MNMNDGFFGTMNRELNDRAEAEWMYNEAARLVADLTGCKEHEARRFLDSVFGRHFANEALDFGLGEAARRWNSRKATGSLVEQLALRTDVSALRAYVSAAQK